MQNITPQEKSWIIGLYRQGNDFLAISFITGYKVEEVEKIVAEYLKSKGEQ